MTHPLLSRPGSDVAQVADLSRHAAYNGASVDGSSPVVLSATAPAWTYLLEFPLPDNADPEALYLAEIAMEVVDGAVSIATLRTDGVTLLDDQRVSAGDHGRREVAVGRAADCRGLLLRTIDSRPIAIRIESLTWRPVPGGCDGFFGAPPRTELNAVPQWSRYYGPHGSALERLRAACYNSLDHPRKMPWLFGLEVTIQPHEQMSRAVFVSGLYEPATMIALRQFVSPGACVIDAGANAGLMTLACAAWSGSAGRVLAFEPSSREYARLVEHVDLNELTNVETSRTALGSSPGVRNLRVAESHYSGLNTLAPRFAYDDVAVDHTEPVEVTTIDAIVADRNLRQLDVIKMDVEGAEADVLRGGFASIRRLRPVLVFEAFEPALAAHGETFAGLAHIVDALEYDTFRIDDDGQLSAVSSVSGGAENFVAMPRQAQGSHEART